MQWVGVPSGANSAEGGFRTGAPTYFGMVWGRGGTFDRPVPAPVSQVLYSVLCIYTVRYTV